MGKLRSGKVLFGEPRAREQIQKLAEPVFPALTDTTLIIYIERGVYDILVSLSHRMIFNCN